MKRKIIVFSGAGLSAESGISTFRDSNGLWENNKVEEICNYDLFKSNLTKVNNRIKREDYDKEKDQAYKNIEKIYKFYNERRKQLKEVEPNIIHKTLAELEKDFEVIHLTQNVDNLLERAGCTNVIHLHGELTKMMCLDCNTTKDLMGCDSNTLFEVNYEEVKFQEIECPCCKSKNIKPYIVFFGEYAPNYHIKKNIFREAKEEDIIVVIGTMGNVVNISNDMAFTYGYKILNNLEKSPYIREEYFNEIYYEKGSTAITKIKEKIKNLTFF